MIAGDDEADRYRDAFTQSELVDKVVTVADFIPVDQDEKLFIIDEMGLLLGDLVVAAPDPAAQTGGARLTALLGFQETLQQAGVNDPVHTRLQANLAALLQAPTGSVREPQDSTGQKPGISHPDAAQLAQLEQMLLASLPGRLEALNASLDADFISLETLPDALKRLWVSADGKHRIEIYPRRDMQDNQALREFVRGIQSISPAVTGPPVINLEASDAVSLAFRQAFLYAFIAITIMLYLLLARKRDVFLALVPPAHCGADHRRHQRAGRLAAELR